MHPAGLRGLLFPALANMICVWPTITDNTPGPLSLCGTHTILTPAMRLKLHASYDVAPGRAEAWLKSRARLAQVISSFTDFAGTDGCVMSTLGRVRERDRQEVRTESRRFAHQVLVMKELPDDHGMAVGRRLQRCRR
jgi:hypothetical protein